MGPTKRALQISFRAKPFVRDLSEGFRYEANEAFAFDVLKGGPRWRRDERLYRPKPVGQAIRDLPPDQITADMNAIAAYVAKLPAANGKASVGGLCWGGAQTFRYVTNNPDLKAGFGFYHTTPMTKEQTIDKDALGRIKAPVYGFYAGAMSVSTQPCRQRSKR